MATTYLLENRFRLRKRFAVITGDMRIQIRFFKRLLMVNRNLPIFIMILQRGQQNCLQLQKLFMI